LAIGQASHRFFCIPTFIWQTIGGLLNLAKPAQTSTFLANVRNNSRNVQQNILLNFLFFTVWKIFTKRKMLMWIESNLHIFQDNTLEIIIKII
jgi:hypothetical protein